MSNSKEYMRTYNKTHAVALLEKKRNRRYVREYGLEPGQYEEMLVKQRGGCAICGRPAGKKRLHVDHDHRTKKVRGLLCFQCNTSLGYMGENRENLARAADYLNGKLPEIETHGWVTTCLRERGKIVPGSIRSESNIWVNTGREYLAMLMAGLGDVHLRTDLIQYIGVGAGLQIENTNILGLLTPLAYSGGNFLAPIDSQSFPLAPSRTTVEFGRVFAENEITTTVGSSQVISEMGLFTNGAQGTFVENSRDVTLTNALLQSPVAYKAFEEGITKTDAFSLEISWQIRM